MKKMSFLFTLLCMMIASTVSAQIAGNALYNNPDGGGTSASVNLNLEPVNRYSFGDQLEANVMMNVKAVGYVAIFSLTQAGKSIEEVETSMRARTDIFVAMLKQNNISEQHIFIDPISLVPTYETKIENKRFSKTYNEIPTGFEMKKNVHITFKDQSHINNIIAVAAKAEVYDLVKVEYAVEDLHAILTTLRNEAMNILLSKKDALERSGLNFKVVNIGEKTGSAYPFERYSQYTAAKTAMPASYVVYGNDKKPVETIYNYAEKSRTIYYDKVPDRQFDKVINPVVGEPMVQVYISIKAQVKIYDAEQEAADKAYAKRLRELELRRQELNVLALEKNLNAKPVVEKKP